MVSSSVVMVLVAAFVAAVGLEPGSALRHLYLVPTFLAALAGGMLWGGVAGLMAGLFQAPVVLPAVERLGLTSETVDGLLSLGAPIALGWWVGRLSDQSRERGERLAAVLAVQRTLSRERALEESLHDVAEIVRLALPADRVGLVVTSESNVIVAMAPRSEEAPQFAEGSAAAACLATGESVMVPDLTTDGRLGGARSTPGACPVRALALPLDSGTGPCGVLAVERARELSPRARAAAQELAMHLALGIENVRLTLRQRGFAAELEKKVASATERLRRLDDAKTEFLSVVAHELRTPLTALQGFSELLLSKVLPADKASRCLGHLGVEAARLGRIVTELLDLSRIETGRALQLRHEAVDLEELVERNVELFAIDHGRHRFEWSVSPPTLRAWADRDALDRMVKNLLSNAVKYSPRGGRVAIAAVPAAEATEMVELSVEDEGVGIPASDLARIFERYVRVANPETTSTRGLGLGLSMVKALAEAHGGRVDVESTPGRGSRFRLVLPRARTAIFSQFST